MPMEDLWGLGIYFPFLWAAASKHCCWGIRAWAVPVSTPSVSKTPATRELVGRHHLRLDLSRRRSACGRIGTPPTEGLCHLGAWKMLQGASSGCGPSTSVGDTGASLRRGAVSFPRCQAGQAAIGRLLPEALRRTPEGGKELLRSDREASVAIASFGERLAMTGTLCREPREYAYLLEELLQKGIIEGGGLQGAGGHVFRQRRRVQRVQRRGPGAARSLGVCAAGLAMGARLVTRWIPSEVNPADRPSRDDLEFGDEVVAVGTQAGRSASEPDEQSPPGLFRLPSVAWRRRPARRRIAASPFGMPRFSAGVGAPARFPPMPGLLCRFRRCGSPHRRDARASCGASWAGCT